MITFEEVTRQPLEQRLARMERTAGDLAAAIRGVSETMLSRRPDENNWSAKEIVCHLRDVEETYTVRVQTMLLTESPTFLSTDPERWVRERQYLRNDAAEALAAFRVRRRETLDVLRKLPPTELRRTCLHPLFGRFTIDQIVGLLAWHDDNHRRVVFPAVRDAFGRDLRNAAFVSIASSHSPGTRSRTPDTPARTPRSRCTRRGWM